MFASPPNRPGSSGAMHSTPSRNVTPSVFDLNCDGCNHPSHRMLRWCDTCKSAICDACVLDHHLDHKIVCYLKVSRESKADFENFLSRAHKDIDQLNVKRGVLTQLKNDILGKVDSISTKMQKRVAEAGEMCETMKSQWNELKALAEMPLNGKTICYRHHAVEVSKTLGQKLLQQQETIERQLKLAHDVIEGMRQNEGGEVLNVSNVVEQPLVNGPLEEIHDSDDGDQFQAV